MICMSFKPHGYYTSNINKLGNLPASLLTAAGWCRSSAAEQFGVFFVVFLF